MTTFECERGKVARRRKHPYHPRVGLPNFTMMQSRFFICLNNEVFPGPPVDKQMPLCMLFYDLLTYQATPRGIPTDVRDSDCNFYKLTPPLLSPGTLEGLEDVCLNNRHSWTAVDSASIVRDLASEDCLSSFEYLCLVIETPQVPRAEAIKVLGDKYTALFHSLQIRVVNIKSWSETDVQYNMNGGVFWHHGEQPNEKAIRDFVDTLSRRRECEVESCDTSSQSARDLDRVRTQFPDAFNLYFQEGSYMVKGSAEAFGVYYLIRSHQRLEQSSQNPSSRCKGSVLSTLFFQSPFCDSVLDSVSDLGQSRFTDDPEIQEHLDRMHYHVDTFLPGFPHVAAISCESDPLERGILKFTRRQSEVDIVQHLSKFTCKENHTIPGIQVWTLPSKGFVIYSCFGGNPLTNISQPDVHMWSAARQLIEGVAFIHSQGVAHLDIKPANVLVHPDSGRLAIIDYSVSQFVKPDTRLHAVRGTEDYIAPEVTVKHAEYDPIRADLWSCGKTLEELIGCCQRATEQTSFLVGIVSKLMALNPLARLMMPEVLKQMIAFESSTVKRPQLGRFYST